MNEKALREGARGGRMAQGIERKGEGRDKGGGKKKARERNKVKMEG